MAEDEPAPTPREVQPATREGAFAIDPETTWSAVVESLAGEERSCLRERLGPELESIGRRTVLSVVEEEESADAGWVPTVFECLEKETADELYLGIVASVFGWDEEIDACLRDLLAETDLVQVIRDGYEDQESPEFAAFTDSFFGCLGFEGSAEHLGVVREVPPPDQLLWQFNTGRAGELLTVASGKADGMVYASSNRGRIYALDAVTGDLVWTFESDWEGVIGQQPVIAGDRIYGIDTLGYFALDARTGEWIDVWEFSELAVDGESVYWGALTGGGLTVWAFDRVSGKQRWQADVERRSDVPLLFPLTATGANLYVSDEYQTHALDSRTGAIVWTFDMAEAVTAPPTVVEGRAYLYTYRAAYALDEATGDILWRSEWSHGGLPGRPPYILNGKWLEVSDGAVRALDVATGQGLWLSIEGAPLFIAGVGDGMVFVTGDRAFRALDAETGDTIWSLTADAGFAEVDVVDGVLYANTLDGHLHALDARTGTSFWRFYVGYHIGGVEDVYLVSDGVVYVGFNLDDGGVYAVSAPAAEQSDQ